MEEHLLQGIELEIRNFLFYRYSCVTAHLWLTFDVRGGPSRREPKAQLWEAPLDGVVRPSTGLDRVTPTTGPSIFEPWYRTGTVS